jgi:4-hydroxybenzoate polyprenyltransferase
MKTFKASDLVLSMRPKQWTKNGFVFAGLLFSRSFIHPRLVLEAFYAFVLFSLVSGTVYIINDILDREKDAHHPRKCKRPIASGRLNPRIALVYALIVLVASLALSLLDDYRLFIILLAYFLLVLAYSLKLKHVVILDVILLSMGFVLRTIGGGVVIDVWISPWLILCTTLLALFLALNKRKNELLVLSEDAVKHRKILDEYTPDLIDKMLSVITSTTVMSYSLYTFSAGKSSYMMLTIPFVLYGIFRYQYLVAVKDMGGSPELAFLQDIPLMIDLILWVVACAVIVLFFY